MSVALGKATYDVCHQVDLARGADPMLRKGGYGMKFSESDNFSSGDFLEQMVNSDESYEARLKTHKATTWEKDYYSHSWARL